VPDRFVGYCCPRAVEAYPARCPDHGQDQPDVVVVDDPSLAVFSPGPTVEGYLSPARSLLSPGGWCAPDGDGWDMLPGPLCHFAIDDDGTVTMFHDPQTHARPTPPPRGLLADLWDALRSLPSWWQSSVEGWARRTVYGVHRPTYVDHWSSHPGPAEVYCCHCSRGRTAVPWPCPPVLKVTR
jgi:hypothetical protein